MAAKPGPVGGIVNVSTGGWPPGTTQSQAWGLWNSATGTTAQVDKIYSDTASPEINSAVSLGIQVIMCYDSPNLSDLAGTLASFTTSVNHLQSIGVTGPGRPGYVVIPQEVEDHLTAAQFLSLMRYDPNGTGVGGFHAAANAAGFQLYWDAAGSHPHEWASFFPGAEFLDGIAVDCYCYTWVNTGAKSPTYLKTLTDLADHPTFSNGSPAPPMPFGLMEIGLVPTNVTQPSKSDFTDYMNWLTQLMGSSPAATVPNVGAMPAGRLARGLANGPVLWYDGQHASTLNQVVPIATASSTYAAYAAQTAYPLLYNAIVAAGPSTLTVTTTSVPNGATGTAYSTTLQASGGTTPYTWSLFSGSLPAGLGLHPATGVIDGTPTGSGTSSFTVQVADSANHTATQALSLTISGTLTVATTSLPNGTTGTAYNQSLQAAGGTPPYTWSITSGALPPGLSLSPSGIITGTPTTAGGYPVTFKVTDSALATATANLTLTVGSPVPGPVRHTPARPGLAQIGTFTPGLQGTAFPIRPLFTTATPGVATPGTFSPGDPGGVSMPAPGPPYTPAVPGQAQPGLFTPGDPGQPVPPPSTAPFIAQQLTKTETYNYGWSAAEFTSNTPGHMLVVIAGWNLNATATAAPMPAAYVCDSALNYWFHAGTTPADNTGSRCSIWVAPNARAVDWVSCSLTTFASSLAWTILEIGNAPRWFTVDVQAAVSGAAGTVLQAAPGTAGSADIGLAVLAAGSTSTALELSPAGWQGLAQVQAGAGQPNGVTLWPFWNPAIQAGTVENVSYLVSASAPLSAVTVLIEAAPNPPLQPDPQFPALKVEAAFGFLPGDPTQAPPAWTDITARCAAKDGTPFIEPAAGKSYELATPETGELRISCRNNDGAFTPGNINSPFAPGTGVVLGTPVRVSAYWEGSWYSVAFGYVERWPQEWPDMPHWGMSAMIATDAFSALSAATSYSALNGDLLLDSPAVLIPCNEQYTTQQNSLNTTVTPSECQGLLAANISRTNQRPGTYVDGTGAQCATGQSNTLLGSQDTSFGCSQFTPPLTPTSSGPGMIYWDPALPSPLAPAGVTVEFWLTITAASAAANVQPVVFTAFAAASNYQTAHPSLQVQVQNFTGNNQLVVTFANGSQMAAPFAPSPNPQQVALVFTALGSFGAATVSLFVNGALAASTAITAAQAGAWQAVMLGCGNYAYHNGALVGGVFSASSLAIYAYALPLQRIVSHYVTGVSGQENVDATTRIAQVLAWNNLGIPRGGQVTFGGITPGVLQGPAYSLAGSNVSTAVNQAAANEQGMAFCSPDGTLQFMHRWAIFNQAPALTFGDNPALGEIPFLPGQAFDYDNSYLFDVVQVQQSQGPTTGIKVTAADTGSQAAYFTRAPLQATIQTMSALDAYDAANQAIAKYSQPQIRLRGLTVDAAANPSAAFPGVLALQQGNAATVNRRPVGGAPISASVIVQKVSHTIGPGLWQASYEMSPYPPLNAVLQLDQPGFDVIGSSALP